MFTRLVWQVWKWLKRYAEKNVDIKSIENNKSVPLDHQTWNTLLTQHVSSSGKVDYQGFINDKTKFETYLSEFRNHPLIAVFTKEEQLAYWIIHNHH